MLSRPAMSTTSDLLNELASVMQVNSIQPEMLLSTYFQPDMLGAYLETKLELSKKGGAPVLAARIAKAWSSKKFKDGLRPTSSSESSSNKRKRSPSEPPSSSFSNYYNLSNIQTLTLTLNNNEKNPDKALYQSKPQTITLPATINMSPATLTWWNESSPEREAELFTIIRDRIVDVIFPRNPKLMSDRDEKIINKARKSKGAKGKTVASLPVGSSSNVPEKVRSESSPVLVLGDTMQIKYMTNGVSSSAQSNSATLILDEEGGEGGEKEEEKKEEKKQKLKEEVKYTLESKASTVLTIWVYKLGEMNEQEGGFKGQARLETTVVENVSTPAFHF